MLRNRASENAWLMIVAVVVLCCPAVRSATGGIIYVNPGQSIQAAINNVNNGDEIEVAPGTYYEAIDFKGKGCGFTAAEGGRLPPSTAQGTITSSNA